MKKIISFLGITSLITSGSSNLMACINNNNQKDAEGRGTLNEFNNKQPEQPPENSNWKLINNISNEDATINKDKYYFVIYKNKDKNDWKTYKLQMGIENDMPLFDDSKDLKAFYRWDGNGEPEIPEIDENTSKITNWK